MLLSFYFSSAFSTGKVIFVFVEVLQVGLGMICPGKVHIKVSTGSSMMSDFLISSDPEFPSLTLFWVVGVTQS